MVLESSLVRFEVRMVRNLVEGVALLLLLKVVLLLLV